MADEQTELLPKPGYKTSSLAVTLATILVGGLITYLVRRGLPQEVADANRQLAVDLVSQLLPMAYLALVGAVARAYIHARQVVTQAKANALVEMAKAQAGGGPSTQ